jgi:3,4-dihydroxy 2-butanone 4-phosphate synthase/GTP cyclohydrolase II
MKNAVRESVILRSVRATLKRLEQENKTNPRPAVTLSFAQSLDGCITACRGSSTAISGDQSFLMTHQLRAMHDAILVGINTVLVDDPQLTVRYADGENPIPVVLDSRLRTPPTAKLLQQENQQAIIVTLQNASKEREAKLVEAGARVIRMHEAPAGGIQLTDLFRWLREQQVNTLMVEGGAKVICSVLADRLVDQLVLTIATRFFGQNGLRAVGTLNCAQFIPSFTNSEVEQLGDDVLIRGDLAREETDPLDQ